MKLVAATNNHNKVSEFRALLGEAFDVVTMRDVGVAIEVDETETTFFGNALLKAKAVSEATGFAALADDSGLEVDALDDAPGVYSARYAGEPCDDAANNAKLLKELEGVSERTARFVSVVVLYRPDGSYEVGEGSVEGKILNAPRGTGGFGYDPLFFSTELKKTFGEASPAEKNAVSHRARAIADLSKKLS